MLDICLSGNMFSDTICVVDNYPIENASNRIEKTYTQFGGVDNLLRIFNKSNLSTLCYTTVGSDQPGRTIKYYYKKHNITTIGGLTSNAIIIADKSKNKRTSMVNWGVGVDHLTSNPERCKWHHICYLDTLHKWDQDVMKMVKAASNIVTIDLCQSDHTHSRDRILECLKYVDGIIASDVEFNSLFNKTDTEESIKEALQHVKFCYLHTPDYCLYGDKEILFKLDTIKIDGRINSLGAGDTFCAHVIIAKLSGLSEKDSILYAQEQTKKFLEETIDDEKS